MLGVLLADDNSNFALSFGEFDVPTAVDLTANLSATSGHSCPVVIDCCINNAMINAKGGGRLLDATTEFRGRSADSFDGTNKTWPAGGLRHSYKAHLIMNTAASSLRVADQQNQPGWFRCRGPGQSPLPCLLWPIKVRATAIMVFQFRVVIGTPNSLSIWPR
jgi:hypothetical protein